MPANPQFNRRQAGKRLPCVVDWDWGIKSILPNEGPWVKLLQQLWNDEQGQDIAEYAVMLAVILVIVVGTVRLIGSNANNVFSNVGSAIAQ